MLAFVFDELGATPTSSQTVRDTLASNSVVVKSHGFDDKTISFDGNGDRIEIDQRLLVTVGENGKKPFVVLDDQCLL